jgi:hypothetical protein
MRQLSSGEILQVTGASLQGATEIFAGNALIRVADAASAAPLAGNLLRAQGQAMVDKGAADNDSGEGGGSTGPSGQGPRHDVWECVQTHSCSE